jgi:hypothetical protein
MTCNHKKRQIGIFVVLSIFAAWLFAGPAFAKEKPAIETTPGALEDLKVPS